MFNSANNKNRLAKVVHDAGWTLMPTSIPRRGIYDYERVVVFDIQTTETERLLEIDRIKREDDPGYCWWKVQWIDKNTAKLYTTMDSSD